MKKKVNCFWLSSLVLLAVFCIFTVMVRFVDVSAVGPNNSSVGFSELNAKFHELTNVNFTLYNITDWLGLVPIFMGIGYALIGLCQLIKRRSLKKVDANILALGVFYVIVFAVYCLFEFLIINYRPVLIDGNLEVSYPSSTTMLAFCFVLTSIDSTNKYIKNKSLRLTIAIISLFFTAFMVIGRTISGVHWLTDIVGGLIISISLVLFYFALNGVIFNAQEKSKKC